MNFKHIIRRYSAFFLASISILSTTSMLVLPLATAYAYNNNRNSSSHQINSSSPIAYNGNGHNWQGGNGHNATTPVVISIPAQTTPTLVSAPVTTAPTAQGSIRGIIYNDLNSNGILDLGEPLLSGWTVNLYSGTGWSGPTNQAPFATAVSDTNGLYSFNNLADGTYSIEEVNQSSLTQFTEDYNSVVVSNGSIVAGENFGNVGNANTSTTVVTTPAPAPTPTPTPTPVVTPLPVAPTVPVTSTLQWGAFTIQSLSSFENSVGATVNLQADFEGWDASFPTQFNSTVGQAGKTLVIFWEPSFGYSTINNGSQDAYIRQFAAGAKAYGYPVILAPFDEFNLNETAWGYGQNGNTAASFVTAWRHIHDLFASAGATNVKFALDYNNVSIPNSSDNSFAAYYPGAAYVDYVAVDGFNFNNPWTSFADTFDSAIAQLNTFNKPIYILSTASVPGAQKSAWITEMGTHIKTYSNVIGWIWFDSNSDQNWLVNTDAASLAAFKAIIP